MTFNKTMNPTHNLWSNDDDYNNNGNSNSSGSSSSNGSGSSSSNGSGSGSGSGSNNTQTQSNNNMWNRNLDDYNNGKWDPKSYNKPSENNYTDYYTPTQYGMNTPKNTIFFMKNHHFSPIFLQKNPKNSIFLTFHKNHHFCTKNTPSRPPPKMGGI